MVTESPTSILSPQRPAPATGLTDWRKAAALVVDGNTATRMTLAGQLRTMGLHSVSQARRVSDARRELERSRFDVVICGDQFPLGDGTGQELLDDLRRSGLLPYQTVFILLTHEPTYLKVAEAAESSVDSYIARPFSAGTLSDRIEQARKRKAALLPIYAALERGQPDEAVTLARSRLLELGPQWLQATRLGAEVLLRLGRHDEAQTLFQSIWDIDPKPWAQLGVARAQIEAGFTRRAQELLEALIEAQPDYPEAYDVMGRVLMELGQFQAALGHLEKALALTPMAIGRLQRLGMLGYFCGNRDRAIELLERSTYLGLDSKMFDSECLVLLALTAYAHEQPAQLERHLAELRKRLRSNGSDIRLQRCTDLIAALSFIQQGHRDKAARLLELACAQIDTPAFDMEAACNLLCALSWLEHKGTHLLQDPSVIDRIGLRFATSKAMGDLLANAAQSCAAYSERLQRSQEEIIRLIEKSVKEAGQADPVLPLQQLVRTAETSLNARAVESAWWVVQRYASQLADAEHWLSRVARLRLAYGTARNKPALGDKAMRPSGGVNLGPMDASPNTP